MELYDIPESWLWTIIDEVGLIQTGNTPPKKDPTNYGDFMPLVKPPQLNDGLIADADDYLSETGTKKGRILEPNSVLVSCIGILGKTGLNIMPIAFNQQINAITFYSGINPRYGFYYLQGYFPKRQLESLASATTIPIVNKSKFSGLSFPLAPFNEQVRIVSKIEELFSRLDSGVQALKQTQHQLEQYKQVKLKQAFTGELTQKWRQTYDDIGSSSELVENTINNIKKNWRNIHNRKKYVEPISPNFEDLPIIPEEWTWATWDQISEWVTYGFTRPMPHVADGIPIITAKNVLKSNINFENTHKTPIDNYNQLSEKDKPQKDDILITKDGTIGRAAIVKTDIDFCINQSVAVVWLRNCDFDRNYLLTVIEAPFTQRMIFLKARGVALKHLSITDFRKMPLPVPPIEEQNIIADKIQKTKLIIQNNLQNLNLSIQKSQALKQSVLKRAFSGRLVPKNPSDEPAFVLLDRIKTEKAKMKPTRRHKRRRKGQEDIIFKLTPARKEVSSERSKEFG